jgi:hypothetical protein
MDRGVFLPGGRHGKASRPAAALAGACHELAPSPSPASAVKETTTASMHAEMPGQQPDAEQNGQQTAPPDGQHTAPALAVRARPWIPHLQVYPAARTPATRASPPPPSTPPSRLGGSIGTALLNSLAAALAHYLIGKDAASQIVQVDAAIHSYTVGFWCSIAIFAAAP